MRKRPRRDQNADGARVLGRVHFLRLDIAGRAGSPHRPRQWLRDRRAGGNHDLHVDVPSIGTLSPAFTTMWRPCSPAPWHTSERRRPTPLPVSAIVARIDEVPDRDLRCQRRDAAEVIEVKVRIEEVVDLRDARHLGGRGDAAGIALAGETRRRSAATRPPARPPVSPARLRHQSSKFQWLRRLRITRSARTPSRARRRQRR